MRLLVFGIMFISAIAYAPVVAAREIDGDTAALIQRAADFQGVTPLPKVTIGSLPADWTAKIPLPAAGAILGSVSSQQTGTTIYYRPTDAVAALASYAQTLRSAGYTRNDQFGRIGGFVESINPRRFETYCRAGEQISVLAPGDATDLRVTYFSSVIRHSQSCDIEQSYVSRMPEIASPPQMRLSLLGSGISANMGDGSGNASAIVAGERPRSADIMAWFTGQVRRQGWRVVRTVVTDDAAAMTMQRRAENGTLKGAISLLRLSPTTFEAHMDVYGRDVLVASPAQTAAVSARTKVELPKQPVPASEITKQQVVELLDQVLDTSPSGSSRLYFEGVPSALPHLMPLPQHGSILATVQSIGNDMNPEAVSYQLYYRMEASDQQQYAGDLAAQGWREEQQFRTLGFTVPSLQRTRLFCKNGIGISVTQSTHDAEAVTLYFGGPCPMQISDVRPSEPVPEIVPPAGATVLVSRAGLQPGNDGAQIDTSKPLKDVLADFAAQMQAAGWTARPAVVAEAIGSQSFALTDASSHRWQAVLTVYRSDIASNRYYAFIDLTKLTQ